MILNGHTDDVFIDTEIHEYTFVLSENKEVCEIGYQSQPAISTALYLIEIIDNTNNLAVYSGNHIFSASETSYVTPGSTTNLQLETSYTLRRTILLSDANGQFGSIIGRIARKSEMNFPYTDGIMSITSANFYQASNPGGVSLLDDAVPYIDLIFTD